MPLRRPSLADGECQERTYAHQFSCLQKCLVDAWPGVLRHVEADRYVHFLTRCEPYADWAEPNAFCSNLVARFGDQIATHETNLPRQRAIVAQAGVDLCKLPGCCGACCA